MLGLHLVSRDFSIYGHRQNRLCHRIPSQESHVGSLLKQAQSFNLQANCFISQIKMTLILIVREQVNKSPRTDMHWLVSYSSGIRIIFNHEIKHVTTDFTSMLFVYSQKIHISC